jgi:hypothetical protein
MCYVWGVRMMKFDKKTIEACIAFAKYIFLSTDDGIRHFGDIEEIIFDDNEDHFNHRIYAIDRPSWDIKKRTENPDNEFYHSLTRWSGSIEILDTDGERTKFAILTPKESYGYLRPKILVINQKEEV